VNEEKLHDETEIRRFLLGEMMEDERTAFEEKFIAEENLFERTRVVEDELIESYTRKTLSAVEREKFERSFLSTEPRRRRVAFARMMLDRLTAQKEIVSKKIVTTETKLSVWDSITNFFKMPKLVFGAAFALLALIFGGWLLSRNSYQTEIAQQITPIQTIQVPQLNQNQNVAINQNIAVNSKANSVESNFANKNVAPNANRETPNKNQNSTAPKPDSIGIAPVLALFSGTVRDSGRMSELNLPKNAPGASLQLNLESSDYKIYRVEIVNPDGRLVFQNNKLTAKNKKINVFIPAAKLRRGDYMVKLSALNSNNENESVADYSFRILQK